MKEDLSQSQRDRSDRLDQPYRSSTALCFQILNLDLKFLKKEDCLLKTDLIFDKPSANNSGTIHFVLKYRLGLSRKVWITASLSL